MLETFGVSPKLAARYAESGWLVRLGHGIYAYPNDNFDASGALRLLQERVAGLRVAVPERAVLELLYDTGTRESLEESRNLFDSLRSPRKDVLGRLLACCSSVKAVRLFLTWARETGVIDVDELLAQYPVRSGSARRWMSRLDDGTLLSLNPHG